MRKKRYALFFSLIIVLILLLAWMNIVLGSVDLSPAEIVGILAGDRSDVMHANIICGIRLPRMAGAFLLGGALALSGYLLQTFFGNPIVGPFVLGISSGAKLTVALTMIFFLSVGSASHSSS